MTTWNYRTVRLHDEDAAPEDRFWELREVFYDEAGKPVMMTSGPATASSETPEGVIKVLKMMLKDAEERDVFVPPPNWLESPK